MLYALLLLIIAILLLGSSRILGALGAVLGFAFAVLALGTLAYFASPWLLAIGLNDDQILPAIVGILLTFLVVGRLAVYLIERRK